MSEFNNQQSLDEPRYFIVLSGSTVQQIIDYKRKLLLNGVKPGLKLLKLIEEFNSEHVLLSNCTTENFISLLLSTKEPVIFAEQELRCDGSDWTNLEVKILGEINIAVPVKFFDNGVWSVSDPKFREHKSPFLGELLFTPGPLLNSSSQFMAETPDFLEVVVNNHIDQIRYNKLIDRRLSPLLTYIDVTAKRENCTAIVVVPGLGCGAFAGKFRGTLGERLNDALKNILRNDAKIYSNILCVYYDPFQECEVESKDFDGVKYRVRPFIMCGKSQLCAPQDYQEGVDDFSKSKLFKLVAWDHLSYPGNDYFVGCRSTDDGVAAAATNSMEVITGIKGNYKKGYYYPPKDFENWEQVVENNNIKLIVNGNIRVVPKSGVFLTLDEYEQFTVNV